MTTSANPQGKGLVPVMQAWRGAQPTHVKAKAPGRLLADYFTTLLILSAEFAFKPCRGVAYYLYRAESAWQLSLIGPSEWGQRLPGPCLGRCELKNDMTWRLHAVENIEDHPSLLAALEQFREAFAHLLDQAGSLEEGLPFYAQQLPYYQRLLAAGMASSLSQSIQLAGLSGRSSRHWLDDLSSNASQQLLGSTV